MVGITKLSACVIWLSATILASMVLFAATPAFANQLSMQIPGINSGNPIPIMNYSLIVSAGVGGGHVTATSATVTKRVDKSSAALRSDMINGKNFVKVTILEVGTGGQRTTIAMQNVRISALNQSGPSGSGQSETLVFQFAKVVIGQSTGAPEIRKQTSPEMKVP